MKQKASVNIHQLAIGLFYTGTSPGLLLDGPNQSSPAEKPQGYACAPRRFDPVHGLAKPE